MKPHFKLMLDGTMVIQRRRQKWVAPTDSVVKLLRLKTALGVSKDKEVAELLGLSPTAFTRRKQRDSFPEDKLLALSVRRPELKLDTTYILTGELAS